MVGIILVNYNGASDTIDCISSLENMNNQDFITIVIDNCSTDDSINQLEKFQCNHKFIIIKAVENKGFSAGNNIGIQYALANNCSYVWLLNNDTIVKQDTLDYLLDCLKKDKSYGVSIGKILYENKRDIIWYAGGSLSEKTCRTEHWNYGLKNCNDDKAIQNVTFVTGCCMLITKTVIEDIGLMDESFFLYEEDAEYSLRIAKAGFKLMYQPNAVIYHKVSSSTGQTSPLSQYYMVRNKYILIRRYFNGKNKIIAYLYTTFQMFARCLKQEISFKYYLMALKAFQSHETGKRDKTI